MFTGNGFQLTTIVGGVLVIVFLSVDYYSEKKRHRGLSTRGYWIFPSEADNYAWYSWMRYGMVMIATHLATRDVLQPPGVKIQLPVSLLRFLLAAGMVVGFFALLIIMDRFWDKKRNRQELSESQELYFWAYWWLRYPLFILVTVWATKFGLQL